MAASPLDIVLEIKNDNLFQVMGLALDQQGNMYVVQNRNGSDPRIHKFDPAGNLVTSWGSLGEGDGEFKFPALYQGGGGVAVDDEGNVYVSDGGNARVQKFDSNGKFLLKWGTEGEDDGQFGSPFGLAVSSQGFVYVAEYGRNVVQKFDTNGTFLGKWGDTQAAGTPLALAGFLGVDVAGNLYIPMYAMQKIQKLDPDGQMLAEFLGKPINSRPPAPIGVAVDEDGNIYITEADGNRMVKFDENGAILNYWGGQGAKGAQFDKPMGIAVDDDGYIYVADYANRRILKLRQP